MTTAAAPATLPATVPCPLTGRPARLLCRKGPAEYYLTPDLGLIFQREVPTVAQMAAYAEEQYAAGGLYKDYAAAAPLKHATFERRLSQLQALGGHGRLLDVGCACGFLIETALRRGFDAYGVEFSAEAIALAAPEVQTRITQGDVNLLRDRGDEPFDVVVAFDILEHTQRPVDFLRDLRGVLRPGGWIVLATPDTGHFLRPLMGRRWPMLQPMQHTFLFSKPALRVALEQAGFSDITVRDADKTLTADYLLEQLRTLNPVLHALYRVGAPLLPRSLRSRKFAVNIGEMLAFARRPAAD